jgi:ribulose-phosphate 3-epimerase
VCRALKRVTRAPLEVHLLVRPCERLVAAFADAGADLLVFHPEASDDLRGTVAAVRRRGCAVGLALAIGAPLDVLDGLVGGVDVVLATGAGAPLSPLALRWVHALRRRVSAERPGIAVSAEGGVDVPGGAALAGAGVDELVVESLRCGASERAATIAALRRALRDRAPSLPAAARRRAGELAS